MILKLSSSTSGIAYAPDASNVLSPNAVYTILAGGPIATPQLLVR